MSDRIYTWTTEYSNKYQKLANLYVYLKDLSCIKSAMAAQWYTLQRGTIFFLAKHTFEKKEGSKMPAERRV